MADDNIQHGIDDNPNNDATKGGVLGAVGGAAVGAAAGGPVGALVGAIAGGLASAAGVAAVDAVDNDNNITGVGSTPAIEDDDDTVYDTTTDRVYVNDAGHNVSTPAYTTTTPAYNTYNTDPDGNKGMNQMEELGETVPSIKTGGYANDGTPDTRGIGEKTVDAITGDVIDDKTGKVVNHP